MSPLPFALVSSFALFDCLRPHLPPDLFDVLATWCYVS